GCVAGPFVDGQDDADAIKAWNTRSAATAQTPSAAQISELDDANNACLELAAQHGLATGHGDTVADMIREFSGQIRSAPAQAPDAEAEITWLRSSLVALLTLAEAENS